jgi:hypothetical protein
VSARLVTDDEADPVASSHRTKNPRPFPGSLLANAHRADAAPVPEHRIPENAVTVRPSAAHQGEDTP